MDQRLLLPSFLFASLLLLSGGARAEPPDPTVAPRWRMTVSAGTHFPVDVGVRLQAAAPSRLQLVAGVGVMPGPYVDTLNATLVAFDVYSEAEGELIKAALRSSLIWRTHLGWQPFPDAGFYFQAGYTLVTLGGGLTAAEAVAVVTGQPVPDDASGRVEVTAQATLHQLSGELGWQWTLRERWLLQVSLGGFGTLTSSTRLSAPRALPRVQTALEPLFTAGEAYLDDTFRSYVHGGSVGLRIGYTF